MLFGYVFCLKASKNGRKTSDMLTSKQNSTPNPKCSRFVLEAAFRQAGVLLSHEAEWFFIGVIIGGILHIANYGAVAPVYRRIVLSRLQTMLYMADLINTYQNTMASFTQSTQQFIEKHEFSGSF